MRRRLFSLLCTLSLLLALLVPTHASTQIIFTAVNERVRPLTSASMPFWSDGMLYVPYDVFDSGTTGISLGTISFYNKSDDTVNIYNLREMMVFDLNKGVCYNESPEDILPGRAIIRNGTVFVPAARVCNHLGLTYSYRLSAYGYLVRITNHADDGGHPFTDDVFLSAASDTLSRRLQEYNQSLRQEQAPVPPPQPEVTPPQDEPDPTAIPTYLAVRCKTGQAALPIAQSLEETGLVGLFFFPAQEIGHNGALIRRLMGNGHSIGILAEGQDEEETDRLLSLGADTLSTVARTRTYYALVPEKYQDALSNQGWVFWNSTADATPDGSLTPYSHALALVRSLPKRGAVQLILNDSQLSADAISTLLRQLENRRYTITIPRETCL